MKRKILITGCEGYLASKLIERLLNDERIEKIIGVDIKEKSCHQANDKFFYVKSRVENPELLKLLNGIDFDTTAHTAWTFNPVHDLVTQDRVDIAGTENVLRLSLAKKTKRFIYTGSTTCYGQIPANPVSEPFLKESDWDLNAKKRLSSKYRYARNKAIVDAMMQRWARDNPDMNYFWVRAAIVLGKTTNNIVSYIAKSPFTFGVLMFRVRGYDPPMQFLSEDDITEILFRSVFENWSGPVNLAGDGVLKYSEVIKLVGRKELCLPWRLLYGFTALLWKLRLFKFPPALLYMIRYPWVADIGELKEKLNYKPKHTSAEALLQFASTFNQDKAGKNLK